MNRIGLVVAVVGLAGCAVPAPTISTGITGFVTQHNDVGPSSTMALGNFQIDAFAVPAVGGLGSPIATTKSDAQGFYELGLSPGPIVVCSSFKRCVRVVVPSTRPLDLHYSFSNGPGWSSGTTFSQ